ncbi:ABC transporter permease [Luteococcus sp. OSA5]|uniref:ABC transporter permease n=1 Tax=Luteococcus sp. OSA5 TaxID=3401630 RepID=UPI003B43BD85
MTDTLLPTRGHLDSGRTRPATLQASTAVLLAVVGHAVLTPMLAPGAWHEVDLSIARQAPSLRHWFGTDNAGRDLFLRVAQGLRVSLLVAVCCATVSTVFGLLVGTVAAAAGRWWDGLLMRLADATNALPHLVLGIVVVAFFPGSLTAIIASVALTHWPQVARLVRSVALTTHRMEYVEAAYLGGASRWAVLRSHLLPAAAGQGVVALVLLLPHAVWHESTLSFLGLGLAPDRASLGTLLEISRGEIFTGAWWTLFFPAALLVLTTMATAGLAAALRRRLSPTEPGRLE